MGHGGWPMYHFATPHAVGPPIGELPDPEPVAQPVVAFRAWKFRAGALAPMMKADGSEDWTPLGSVTAVCRCGRNQMGEVVRPDMHQCGFYGFRRYRDCLREYRSAGGALFGAVAFSRRVYEFEFGFRAERATPLALLETPPSPALSVSWRDEILLPTFAGWDALCEFASGFGHMDEQEEVVAGAG